MNRYEHIAPARLVFVISFDTLHKLTLPARLSGGEAAHADMTIMQNEALWKPSKYIERHGRIQANPDPELLNLSSRLMANLIADQYQKLIPAYAKGKLADIGCGTVPLYAAYRPHVSDICCVDWDQSRHAGDHVDLICDLAAPLPIEDASFDTVLFSDVLEHLEDPAAALKELHRILRPGGHVLLNVPFFYPLHEQPHDFYRYTEFALRSLAKRNGFEVIVLEAIGGIPEVFGDFTSKMLARHRLGRFFAKAVQAGIYRLVQTRKGRTFSQRSSRSYPLGYAMVLKKGAVDGG